MIVVVGEEVVGFSIERIRYAMNQNVMQCLNIERFLDLGVRGYEEMQQYH